MAKCRLQYGDLESGIVSMGRTTGYTGSILAPMLHSACIRERGVVEPEKLGADLDLFEKMLEEYERRGIIISEAVH